MSDVIACFCAGDLELELDTIKVVEFICQLLEALGKPIEKLHEWDDELCRSAIFYEHLAGLIESLYND